MKVLDALITSNFSNTHTHTHWLHITTRPKTCLRRLLHLHWPACENEFNSALLASSSTISALSLLFTPARWWYSSLFSLSLLRHCRFHPYYYYFLFFYHDHWSIISYTDYIIPEMCGRCMLCWCVRARALFPKPVCCYALSSVSSHGFSIHTTKLAGYSHLVRTS